MSQLFASGDKEYWSFSFSISPSSEYSGLISFKIDWFDLLAVQGTHKSLLQDDNLKTSSLQCSVFFMVQLSHPQMTTGKTIAFIKWTLVSKEMSLLFNFSASCLLYGPVLTTTCEYWKDHSLGYMKFCQQSKKPWLSNTLSRFVIIFLPRKNCLLILWLQSPSVVILEPKKRKSVTASIFSPSTFHEMIVPDAMILVFLNGFKPAF